MKVMVEVEVEEIAEQILKQLAESGDVISVVRCKDCERWIRYEDDVFGNCTFNHGVTDKYFFCADGERKEE